MNTLFFASQVLSLLLHTATTAHCCIRAVVSLTVMHLKIKLKYSMYGANISTGLVHL